MRIRALAWAFFSLLLVSSSAAPALAASVSWFCEGRFCGWQVCCCESAAGDLHCDRLAPRAEGQTTLCSAACGCTLQIQASGGAMAAQSAPAPFPAPPLATLPATHSLPVVGTLPVASVLPPVPRGPPAARAGGALPSLRAPPVF